MVTEQKSTPINSASLPPSFATDLSDTPQTGQSGNVISTTTSINGGETKSIPTTTPSNGVETKPSGNSAPGALSEKAPGADMTAILGAPGTAPAGKIYKKTGELLNVEDYKRRNDEDEALIGYDQQIAALREAADAVDQETPEQRAKRERQEKSKKIIAATADGLSALSNLFFTSQYAPNAYNHQSSQLNKVNSRIEALKAERKADADRYNNLMLRLGDAQNARAKALRDIRAQHEAQKLARQKAEQEAEEHGWKALLQPDIQREQKGKADRAEQQAIASGVEAQYAPQMQEAKLQTEKARAGAQMASAANSYASAGAHNRSNPNEYSAWDENGREHKFRTKDAADRFAKQHGTWQEEEEVKVTDVTRKNHKNQTSTSSSSVKTKGGQPAKPQSKDNTPPSRRGNNDNVPPSRRNK